MPRKRTDPESYTVRHVRVPKALDAELVALAATEERSVTQIIILLCKHALPTFGPRPLTHPRRPRRPR